MKNKPGKKTPCSESKITHTILSVNKTLLICINNVYTRQEDIGIGTLLLESVSEIGDKAVAILCCLQYDRLSRARRDFRGRNFRPE